jgi:hypothetical protein
VSTEIVRPAVPRGSPAPTPPMTPARMGRALIVADALQQEADQRKLLGEYVRHHMAEGTDYGVVPGTKNKTLLKPGAEKLTQLFRCVPRFVIEEKLENWDTGLFYYRFSCQVVSQADDAVVAEGVGSCSTYESRYRWRAAGRVCPECGKEAIIKGKAEFGGGWLCFKKKDGCGAKFDDHDPAITDQPTGRVQNPDLLDSVNTVLKMAKKRALVDAAIALARCSDIFTQDIDDEIDAPEAARPAPRPTDPYANSRARLRGAATVADLGAIWGNLPPDVQRACVADKDARKAALLAAAPAQVQPEPAPAAPEGEQRADFPRTPVAPTTGPLVTTPSPTEPPKAGANIVQVLLGLCHELGVSWTEIRDRAEGKGADLAAAAGLDLAISAKVTDLTAEQALRLKTELDARVAEKEARAAKREANRARREQEAAEERQEVGAGA